MPSAIHHPRALLDWQARAVRSRSAHLYRVSQDGRGNWTVTRPGTKDRLYFPADDSASPPQDKTSEGAEVPKPTPPARLSPVKALNDSERYALEVRNSWVNLSA